MARDVCAGEIDYFVLRSLRNDSSQIKEDTITDVKRDILSLEGKSIEKSMIRAEEIISRFTAVVDPLIHGLVPFYAFINVRENFKAVTDSIKQNIESMASHEMIIGIYDLIGKPDFLIIGLTRGTKGKHAEQFIHSILSELGGERIHNNLTVRVEIPRSIKKFWHQRFNLEDLDEGLKKAKEADFDPIILKEFQEECRFKIKSSEIRELEERGIIRGYSVVIDPSKYQSEQWNFIKAFIQVDALYDKVDSLFIMLEGAHPRDIRSVVEIPYNRYGILVEVECASIGVLGDIMGSIRNCDYVRTTSTAIVRDVVREELWMV